MNQLVMSEPNLPAAKSNDNLAVEARESQFVQAMVISARKFPRDENTNFKAIIASCERPTLAEIAVYSFPRGGQTVSGPSIRLAQVLKQKWGNMRSGWRETERLPGRSKVYTWAWDLETNTIDEIEFFVEHVRETKKGPIPLTDPRDIYEMIANQARRRERSNILAIMPGDVVEAATAKCNETMSKATDLKKAIPIALKSFEEFGVTQAQLEVFCRKKITAFGHGDFVKLKNILLSLKDGMSKPADYFEALHEPEKIKREQAEPSDDGKFTPPADKKKEDLTRAGYVKEFDEAYLGAKQRGLSLGEAMKVLGMEAAKVRDRPIEEIAMATDIMNAWGK